MGTLLGLEDPVPRLRGELAARFGLQVDAATARRALAAEIAHYRAHATDGRDAAGVRVLRTDCARVLRDALGPGAAPLGPGDLAAALLASLRFRPFPDVAPALRALREAAGLRLVVASNWDVSLHAVLAEAGLLGLVDGVVTSAEAGDGKPGGAIFTRALALAQAPPERAVHVGDSVAEDVAGARAAGIVPVLLVRGAGAPPPGVRAIHALTELSPPAA